MNVFGVSLKKQVWVIMRAQHPVFASVAVYLQKRNQACKLHVTSHLLVCCSNSDNRDVAAQLEVQPRTVDQIAILQHVGTEDVQNSYVNVLCLCNMYDSMSRISCGVGTVSDNEAHTVVKP